MRLCWVLSEEIQPGTLDMQIVRSVAPSWGSWKVWKNHKIDNCVCTSTSDARDLIKRAFHAVTNFYVMQDTFTKVGNPVGVKVFNGTFKSDNIDNKDNIVALNLAAPNNDLVLLSGFDFSPISPDATEVERLARDEYYFNVRELIKQHSGTQFVLIDHQGELAQWAKELDNLTLDTLASVESLLA